MTNKIRYLIKLTPNDFFFFGGKKTLGEENDSYFVESNYFPQQNALLGLIRYQLLVHSDEKTFKDNKIQDKTEAQQLIGEKSFSINDTSFNFGKIHSLSPLFICNEAGNHLFPCNKEYQQSGNHFVFKSYIKKHDCHYLEGFNPKYGLPDLFIDNKMNKYPYDFDPDKKEEEPNGIFTKFQKVGIKKDYNALDDNKSYFIQTYRGLKKGYSFAFILELENDAVIDSNPIVHLGAERRSFSMEVTKDFDKEYDQLLPPYEPTSNYDKIILTSDAYITQDMMELCEFSITEIQDYQFLISKVKKGKHNYNKPDKSDKYHLYKKGSVFFGDKETLADAIENSTFKSIGYNHYSIINKK